MREEAATRPKRSRIENFVPGGAADQYWESKFYRDFKWVKSDMTKALTSWKEIARHLGKGVRTVQRREHEGLPIRRPDRCHRGRVLAYPDELDGWLRTQYKSPGQDNTSEVEVLREAVEKLLAENHLLRVGLNSLMGIPFSFDEGDFNHVSLMTRCSRALRDSVLARQRFAELSQRNASTRQACAETTDALKNMVMLAAMSQPAEDS